MSEQEQNKIVVLCGFRGSGKTTLAQTLLKPQPNIVVYDPSEDPAYDWIPNTAYSLKRGPGSLAGFFEWCGRKQKSSLAVRYVPGEDEKGRFSMMRTSSAGWFGRVRISGLSSKRPAWESRL
jgi:energy-coupling factor transporter ATP-binding protein EcfA2